MIYLPRGFQFRLRVAFQCIGVLNFNWESNVQKSIESSRTFQVFTVAYRLNKNNKFKLG